MYKLHLILKYLRRRRIAWVSLIAVMLCTTMVLVVISVMGGWLDMFENSARGLTGDVVVRSQGLSGFPYHQEMIERIQRVPHVQAAVPTINTYGLLNIENRKTVPVQVMGMPLEQIGKVIKFPDSLYRQRASIEEALKDRTLTPEQRAALQEKLKSPPTFDLHETTRVTLETLPDDVPWTDQDRGRIGNNNDPIWQRLTYDRLLRQLVFDGRMTEAEKEKIAGFSTSRQWKAAVTRLSIESNWPGMICGAGVLDIRKGRSGEVEGRDAWKYQLWAKLTMLSIPALAGEQQVDLEKNKSEAQFWVVDDSRTGMWQYDNDHVYVPFAVLQEKLAMGPGSATRLLRAADLHGTVDPSDLAAAKADGTYHLEQFTGRGFKSIDSAELKAGQPLGFRAGDAGHVIAVAGDKTFDLSPGPVDAVWRVERQVPMPARVTDIHIRLTPGADALAARQGIADAVTRVLDDHRADGFLPPDPPTVKTWRQINALFIGAIQHEKLLVTFLFGIISIVAIFLIFCIFYMIVAEKTKDIGIIKSVGATNSGVAGILLGYGLTIGIVGAGLGLLASYLIVRYINEIHDYLGRTLGVVVWNPEVYAFDKIPNTMNPREATVIISVAIVASVLGALVPAIRAANLHPVEALRWE